MQIVRFVALTALAALTAGAEPFRFVQISDTHQGRPIHQYRYRQAIGQINALPFDVDVVAHTGDIVSAGFKSHNVAGAANRVAAGAVGAARLVNEAAGGNKARIAVENFERYVADLANMTISFWAKHSAAREPQSNERLFGNRSNVSDQATGLSAVLLADSTAATPVLDVRGNPTLQNSAGMDQYVKVVPGDGVETSWSDTWTHLSFSFAAAPNPTFFHVAGARAAISNNKQGGATQSTTFAAVLPNGTPFSFGNSYDEGQSAIGFKGSIDEIRVRNGSVSDDWAFAEEATVSDPDFLDATGALVPGSMIWLF